MRAPRARAVHGVAVRSPPRMPGGLWRATSPSGCPRRDAGTWIPSLAPELEEADSVVAAVAGERDGAASLGDAIAVSLPGVSGHGWEVPHATRSAPTAAAARRAASGRWSMPSLSVERVAGARIFDPGARRPVSATLAYRARGSAVRSSGRCQPPARRAAGASGVQHPWPLSQTPGACATPWRDNSL